MHPEAQPLSGTSVATVITSAAAAAVWAYRPDMTAAEVAEIVYAQGRATGRPAEYCLRPPCGASRQVSICKAVSGACETHQGACPVAAIRCEEAVSR